MMGITASTRAAASLAGLAMLGTGTTAAAQARREPETAISLSLDVRHDSNVARSNAASASARNLSRADQRATPAINVVVSRPLGRNMLSLNASAGYDFYRRNKRFNRERLSLGSAANVLAGPLTVDLAATLSRSQSDPGDLAPLLIPGANSLRNRSTVQDYSGSVRLGSSPYGLKPMASFGYSQGNNSNELRRISNYRSTRYGGGVSYDGPALGSFTAQYLRTDSEYPDRPATFSQTGFSSDRIELTARRELGSVLTGSAGISWISLKPDIAGSDPSLSTVGWNVALTAVPRPDLQITGAFARDVSPSLGTDALYQVGNTYSLDATYQFVREQALTIRGSINDRRFVGAGRFFGLPLTDSVQRFVSASWSFNQGRPLGAAIDVGYQDRDGNGTFFDYSSVYVGIRTTYRI
ncbi:outer membrane beta-barrel protein [Sphingomonas corticis]|jgi:hypothetical protein|uniref:Outer membrane beta-barrel protein n=1 Tax=Sphingomonas corticis TaxID=2722791 RepID=A0ABX1CIM5_9SPHN|nr:outer membrane beta-barrel protein [Sphingomonas corticis]NJR77850.1 outer membrane beta-barrel protein [Sphingomonas corticis]